MSAYGVTVGGCFYLLIVTLFFTYEGKGIVKVLDVTFAKQNYAIAMIQHSSYREEINRILLKLIESGRYTEILETWFGKEKF